MKKITLFIILIPFCTFHVLFSQTLVNNGGELTVQNGSKITIKGDFLNLDDGSIDNSGDIYISGNWENNATSGNLLQGTTGNVHFNGAVPQHIGGTAFTWFSGLHVQSDVTLHNDISVSTGLLLSGASLDINGQIMVMESGAELFFFPVRRARRRSLGEKTGSQTARAFSSFPVSSSKDLRNESDVADWV